MLKYWIQIVCSGLLQVVYLDQFTFLRWCYTTNRFIFPMTTPYCLALLMHFSSPADLPPPAAMMVYSIWTRLADIPVAKLCIYDNIERTSVGYRRQQ